MIIFLLGFNNLFSHILRVKQFILYIKGIIIIANINKGIINKIKNPRQFNVTFI